MKKLIVESLKQAKKLKLVITENERARLNVEDFEGQGNCLFNQLTGSFRSKRATELAHLTTNINTDWSEKGGYFLRELTEDEKEAQVRFWSPLERLAFNQSDAVKEMLPYLKGETKRLPSKKYLLTNFSSE